MSGYTNPKCKKYYQLAQNFSVHLQTKNQLQPPCFSGDIAKICTLLILSTLGMPGCKHPKWCYQLVEDFHVYLHAKNKLHHSLFFFEILHFKQSYNFIGWHHFGPYFNNKNITRYGIDQEISTTILVFNLDYFRETLSTKFFKKIQKTLFWDHFEPFLPKFGQNWIFL